MATFDFCILGCGKQGRVIGNRLSDKGYKVCGIDINKDNLNLFKSTGYKLSVDDSKILDILKSSEVVINTLPSKFGIKGLLKIIEAERNAVDITFVEEDATFYSPHAKEKNISIVIDAGIAPGLSNMCVGYAKAKIGFLKDVKIYVGGIPKEPKPPLNLVVHFNPEDLLAEYERPVRIVRNWQVEFVPPLYGIEEVEFLDKTYEAFYTDGLRSLTKKRFAKNMFEKTVRYRGHAEWIKSMEKDRLLEILKEYAKKDIEDMMLFRILAEGTEGKRLHFELVDYYDRERKETAMSRTTGYTALSLAEMMLERKISEKGVIPPEDIGKDEKLFEDVAEKLRTFNVNLQVNEV